VSSSDLTLFHFENKPVRTIVRDGDGIWFVAADVCRIFELANVTMALRILDEDEKHTLTIVEGGNINGLGTVGAMPTVISEPGLYKLMGRSRKPEAKRFDRWVRHEVLPAIRKTGSYSVPDTQNVAVASLDAEVRKALGGIIKSVVAKIVDEKFGELEQRIQTITDGYDPRAVVTEYKPMLDVLKEEGVYPKKRRALSQRCSKSILSFCLSSGKATSVRESRETGRWLFQQDAIRDWLDLGGRRMIAEHKAHVAGQTVLPFIKPSI
jgi:prophage antirepressor-like protein